MNQLYPNYKIDVEKEKEKLLWTDTILIQSPLFWYSMTSLIMRWLEEVFEHGWAYGSKVHALDGKKVLLGFTAGSSNKDYLEGGKMGITISEILKPYQITFEYCNMQYLGVIFTGGMFNIGNSSLEEINQMEKLACKHCENIVKLIESN